MKVRNSIVFGMIAMVLMSCDIKINFGSASDSIILSSFSVSDASINDSTSGLLSTSSASYSVSIEDHPHIHESDPYEWVQDNNDREFFYQNDYHEACCYVDAQYRTQHGLLSGDIAEQSHLPENIDRPHDDSGLYYRIKDANYTYRPNGDYESYTINTIDGSVGRKIYYNGAYASLNDVAAYLLAFGETPPNTIKGKESFDKIEAVNSWWKFGRVNDSYYSNDTSKFPYEPKLPESYYYETDFGASTEYYVGNYLESTYNDGTKISGRMACRFVYVATKDDKDIQNRRVFYTYNHYNDFQEYLNYDNGFGERFGNESMGNEPNKYNDSNPPSLYVPCLSIDLCDIIFN